MIIDLSSAGIEPRPVRRTFRPDEIDLEGEDAKLTGPVELKGEIARVDSKTTLHGSLAASIARDCTRCLDPVSVRLAFDFETSFEDAETEALTEIEVNAEELDISPSKDGTIDVADVVREQILLAMPIQNFCSDDCKGLCPACGANLNLIDCKCSDEDVDPRWAALKKLK